MIILAYGGRPLWMNEAFFLVRRHKNMYIDISGIPPQKLLLEYFPRLEEIADKVLFGTDWPGFGVRDVGETLRSSRHCPSPKRPIARFSTTTLLVYSRRPSNSCRKMTSEEGGLPQGFS